MENIIETKHIKQSFPVAGGKELVVLKDINIQIPRGKLTMLRGRSGSGKTTLMNLLSALDYPKEGAVLLEDDDAEPDALPKRTGTPAIPAGNAQPAPKPQQAPEKKPGTLPKTACIVTDMRMQKGMQSTTTVLKLKNAEGKEISAFAQGEHPMLAPGTVLVNTKLTTRKQDSVTYYVLESYDILPPDQRAA